MTRFVGAAEAARHLGVQRATLYAYVSRGLVERRLAVDGRTSLYSLDDLDTLVHDVRATGLDVRLHMEGERTPLPHGLDLSAYRIVQQALTNTITPSGLGRNKDEQVKNLVGVLDAGFIMDNADAEIHPA